MEFAVYCSAVVGLSPDSLPVKHSVSDLSLNFNPIFSIADVPQPQYLPLFCYPRRHQFFPLKPDSYPSAHRVSDSDLCFFFALSGFDQKARGRVAEEKVLEEGGKGVGVGRDGSYDFLLSQVLLVLGLANAHSFRIYINL